MEKNIKILHQHISIWKEGEHGNLVNYLIVIEVINGEPQEPYLVEMFNFTFRDKNSLFYVFNQN
jgi:hypothetical protein